MATHERHSWVDPVDVSFVSLKKGNKDQNVFNFTLVFCLPCRFSLLPHLKAGCTWHILRNIKFLSTCLNTPTCAHTHTHKHKLGTTCWHTKTVSALLECNINPMSACGFFLSCKHTHTGNLLPLFFKRKNQLHDSKLLCNAPALVWEPPWTFKVHEVVWSEIKKSFISFQHVWIPEQTQGSWHFLDAG